MPAFETNCETGKKNTEKLKRITRDFAHLDSTKNDIRQEDTALKHRKRETHGEFLS